MYREEIKQHFLAELSQSSEHTRRSRLAVGEKFLDFAGDRSLSQWNGSLVNEFLEQLRKEGYYPGTIRQAYSIVKRVFDAARAVYEAERTRLITEVDLSKIDINKPSAVAELIKAQTEMQKAISLPPPIWDLGKRAAPRVEAEQVVKPTATYEQMAAVIAAAKDGRLDVPEVAYLALASIYGLRREELCRVRGEHLDFEEKTIYVLTCKGGERRKQLLCDQIIPYLREYDFRGEYYPHKMSRLFWIISAKAGIRPPEESGWHSYRRYLDTELRDLCGELETKIFLRWRMSSSGEMVDRYYSRAPLSVDELVLGRHPLVPCWEATA